MKNLKELGIEVIVLKMDKSDRIKEIQYSINEMIFKYEHTYLFKSEAIELKELLLMYGIELKDNTTPSGTTLKSILRAYIKSLDTYIIQYKEDHNIIQKMINYHISRYVKDKHTDKLTVSRMIKHLDCWKRFKDNVEDTVNLNLKNFNDMQRELLTKLVKHYS